MILFFGDPPRDVCSDCTGCKPVLHGIKFSSDGRAKDDFSSQSFAAPLIIDPRFPITLFSLNSFSPKI